MMNLAQVEEEGWEAESPTGVCNIHWPSAADGKMSTQARSDEDLDEYHVREAECYKTVGAAGAQCEQLWEQSAQDLAQVQTGAGAEATFLKTQPP